MTAPKHRWETEEQYEALTYLHETIDVNSVDVLYHAKTPLSKWMLSKCIKIYMYM